MVAAPSYDVVQDDSRPIRVTVFQDQPECILFHVPDGMRLVVPPLASPFYRITTSLALGEAKVNCRVSESVSGRWTEAMRAMRQAERAERTQLHRLSEAARIAVERNGGPLAQSRAEAI